MTDWNDKQSVLEHVKKGGTLIFASEELKNDKDVVLEAVKNDGEALRFASKELQNDKDVVLEAVKQNWRALYSASEELFNGSDENNKIIDIALENIKNQMRKKYDGTKEYIQKCAKEIEKINDIIAEKTEKYKESEQEKQQVKNDFEKTLENLGKGKGE